MSACLERDRERRTQTDTERKQKKKAQKAHFERLSEKLWIPFHFGHVERTQLADTVFNLKWTMDKQRNVLRRQFFFFRGDLFVIYLKIEQAHSGFHKGDQANGFCQRPSFQVVLKPVNKLNTRGHSQARLINNTHFFFWRQRTITLRTITIN